MSKGARIGPVIALVSGLAGAGLAASGCGASASPTAGASDPSGEVALEVGPENSIARFRARRAARAEELGDRGYAFEWAPERPRQHHTVELDYRSLPVRREMGPIDARIRLPRLHLERNGGPVRPDVRMKPGVVEMVGYPHVTRAVAAGDWLLQVDVAGKRTHTAPATPYPPDHAALSTGELPQDKLTVRDGPRGREARWPATRCGVRSPAVASWQGFGVSGWLDGGIDHVSVHGSLDEASCTIIPRRAVVVRAAALIDGVLYGYRECGAGCDAGDPDREEQLVVIGPPAEWIGATVAPGELEPQPKASFSQVAIPLRRGSSGSAFLNIASAQLSRFLQWRGGAPPAWHDEPLVEGEKIQLSVEVIWAGDEELPTAVARVSLVTPFAAPLLNFHDRAPPLGSASKLRSPR